jgi:heme A synthase
VEPSPAPTPSRSFRNYAWATLAFTLAVILWGAFVRATGSGAGCGSTWPTCNGEIIPRPKTLQTLIEVTHRATSGLSFLMVLGGLVWSRSARAVPPGNQARGAAIWAMVLMTTEALVGAGLVLFEMVAGNKSLARAAWMAAHLTNTFLLVAALALTAYWASGGPQVRLRAQGAVLPLGAAALAGALVLGVTGAITALGDTLFPAGSLAEGLRQDLSATAHFLIRLRALHPIIGLGLGAYLVFAGSALGSRRGSPLVRRLSAAAGGLFLAQVSLGFLNMALLAPVALQLLHLLLADLVWVSLVLLVAASLAEADSTGQHAGTRLVPRMDRSA